MRPDHEASSPRNDCGRRYSRIQLPSVRTSHSSAKPKSSDCRIGFNGNYAEKASQLVDTNLKIYATCPQSSDWAADEYAPRLAEVARWSEEAGCHGALVYTDNSLVDPWLVSQHVINATERLRPLVAVQPIYMEPYAAAKMVSSLAMLHGRAVDLNMLAGGFKNDLVALGDDTAHDDRYERTVEYADIVTGLLAGKTVSAEGRWYRVENLKLAPELPAELMPNLMISGSSEAGRNAAERTGALPIRYPEPVDAEAASAAGSGARSGVRIGIIAREDPEEAWSIAVDRFPATREGELKHQMAMKVSDSRWHRDLSAREEGGQEVDSPYWLGPFNRQQTFCPYLVGSHERIGQELAGYLESGVETFVLDIPPDPDELEHIGRALAHSHA